MVSRIGFFSGEAEDEGDADDDVEEFSVPEDDDSDVEASSSLPPKKSLSLPVYYFI